MMKYSKEIGLFIAVLLLPHASPAQTIVQGIGQMMDSRPRLLTFATAIDNMFPFVRGRTVRASSVGFDSLLRQIEKLPQIEILNALPEGTSQ